MPILADVVTFRAAVRRTIALVAVSAELQHARQALAAMVDDIGYDAACTLADEIGAEYHATTGRCPWCGEAGPFHGPGDSTC